MEFAIRLFLSVLGAVCKRFLVPAIAVTAVICAITAFSGGSWLMAAGICAAISVVAGLVTAFAAINRGW